jgi:XTP/dITP diphosphohydrolase
MSQVLFASQNKHKQQEVATLFSSVGIEVVFPQDFPDLADLDPEETGDTFHQNAEIKAQTWFEKLSISVVAEDTGLQVSALDGMPGVHSKRFFSGTDTDRNKEILRRLETFNDRSAQFITVACLITPGVKLRFFEGIIHGSISGKIRAKTGFGYDPIFIPDGYTNTFSELGQQVKNELSSRARAIKQVASALRAGALSNV